MTISKQETTKTATSPVFNAGSKIELILDNSPDFKNAEVIIDVSGILRKNLLRLVAKYPEKQFTVNNMAPDLLERIKQIKTMTVETMLQSNVMPLTPPSVNTPSCHKDTLALDKKWLSRGNIEFTEESAETILSAFKPKTFFILSLDKLQNHDANSVNQLFKKLQEANCPFVALCPSQPVSPVPFKKELESKIEYFDLIDLNRQTIRWSLFVSGNLDNVDKLKDAFIQSYKERKKEITQQIEHFRLKLNTAEGVEKAQFQGAIRTAESLIRCIDICFKSSPLNIDHATVTTPPSVTTEGQSQAKEMPLSSEVIVATNPSVPAQKPIQSQTNTPLHSIPSKAVIVATNPSAQVQRPQPLQTNTPDSSMLRFKGTLVTPSPSLIQKQGQSQPNTLRSSMFPSRDILTSPLIPAQKQPAQMTPSPSVLVKSGYPQGVHHAFFSNPSTTQRLTQSKPQDPVTAFKLAAIKNELETTARQLTSFSALLSTAATDVGNLVELFDDLQQDAQKKLKLAGEKIAKLGKPTETPEEKSRKSSLTAAQMSSSMEVSSQPKSPGQ